MYLFGFYNEKLKEILITKKTTIFVLNNTLSNKAVRIACYLLALLRRVLCKQSLTMELTTRWVL